MQYIILVLTFNNAERRENKYFCVHFFTKDISPTEHVLLCLKCCVHSASEKITLSCRSYTLFRSMRNIIYLRFTMLFKPAENTS